MPEVAYISLLWILQAFSLVPRLLRYEANKPYHTCTTYLGMFPSRMVQL